MDPTQQSRPSKRAADSNSTTAAAGSQEIDMANLLDPFSSTPPSRPASRASSISSSQSEDSISPSASASQVREPTRHLSPQLPPAYAHHTTHSVSGLQQHRLSSSADGSSPAAQPDTMVQPPPPVDALQPSPLHMLTLLGSQLLQHDQKFQQEEQIHDLGLSGIEELFNELEDESFEEEEATAAQNERSASKVPSSRPGNTPSSALQHSIAAFPDLKDGDDSTPKGPLTPLQMSQLLQRPLASVKDNTTTSSQSPMSPKMPALAENEVVGSNVADPTKSDPTPEHPAGLSAPSSTDKRTQGPSTLNTASNAHKMLGQHLTKLFSLSSASDSPTLRVLSLHSTHLFRAGTLLTGTLYLTNTHVLFYASLRPRAPDAVLQAGTLAVGRGAGWGWAEEAHERQQEQAGSSTPSERKMASDSIGLESGISDSVSTIQAAHSRGSFSAAGARLGAFLRMPTSAMGGSTSSSANRMPLAATTSPSDSAMFGTTPTPSTAFGGGQPISGTDIGSQEKPASLTATTTRRRNVPRLRMRHFVLTPRSLSWYASERDPYFPIGQLDLRWIRSVQDSGSMTAENDTSAANWYIEYVIPPGPRRSIADEKSASTRVVVVDDEAERRYTLLLKAPSAEDAKAWCTVVRRAVLRAGGSRSVKVSRDDAAADSGGFDVRNDSVRVSIPLRCIVDVEGSVGASGVSAIASNPQGVRQRMSQGDRARKGKLKASDADAGPSVEQEEAEGRTLVIRVWDQDATATAQTRTNNVEDAADVSALDEYYFVDLQRQHELWRRLESAMSRISSVTPSDVSVSEGRRPGMPSALASSQEGPSRPNTKRTPSFTYPPSTHPPLPPRTILPRALSGPAKRLAVGLAYTTRPVAVGLGVGVTSVKGFMGHQASGLVERVKEVWNVAPTGIESGNSQALSAASQRFARSRSQSGSEDWQSDDMSGPRMQSDNVDHLDALDEEAGPAADADMDLADSLSFSVVDRPSAALGGEGDDSSEMEVGRANKRRSPEQRSDLDRYNLELFRRTFVLPLSLAAFNPSDSDPDILRSAISSPASRSVHSSDLERSTSAERLLATFSSASLFRVLPLAGRLFVSERFLCFRSARGISSRVNAGIGGLAQGAAGLAAVVSNLATTSTGPANKSASQSDVAPARTGSTSVPTAGSGAGGAATGGGRTLMMLPLVDVIGVASNRAYRYGHWGMVVMIRGHEEIFFEFSSKNEQKLCISTIEHQMEVLHQHAGNSGKEASTERPLGGVERSDALILKDLGDRLDWSLHSSMHSSLHRSILSVDDIDTPAQAARRLQREGRLTSPVTSPSSPRLGKASLAQTQATSLLESERMRSRSISAMSAPGLRSVDQDDTSSGVRGQHGGGGDVSTVDTDTGTTSSSDLLWVATRPKKSLHFTMLTIGSRGDVQPYIALSKRLLTEGHQVRIATHGEFKDWIEGHGIEFYEVGGDPAELMRICVENGTFTLSFLKESVTKFRGWLDDLLVSSWAACQGTDVVIESPSAMAGIHIAEALQVPYFRAFTMPWTRTRTYPHAFAVPSGKAGGNYNYMTYVIFDQVFWRASAGQVNRWRRKTLGLRSTNLDEMAQHKVPFLYNFSPSLVPKPLDWYEWIHVTGFWFLDGPDNSKTKQWQPPAELVSFVQRARDARRKVVYIGWGSIVLSNAEETHQIVVEAVRKTGVCAILSKGWSDRLSQKTKREDSVEGAEGGDQSATEEEEDDMSDRIIEVDSVPHDWLFPQLDAACHHGGAGTLGASLRAGIPTIVKPHFADQFFWGQQVETLGVGGCIRGELTCDKLADALLLATRSEKMVRRARDLGERIRKEDGVGEAIKALYRNLDYAASLIKTGTGLDGRSGGKKFVGATMSKSANRYGAYGSAGPSSGAKAVPTSERSEIKLSSGQRRHDEGGEGDGALSSRKSRETMRDVPYALSQGVHASTRGSDVPAAVPSPERDGDGTGETDADSETTSEAWSVLSGSEERER